MLAMLPKGSKNVDEIRLSAGTILDPGEGSFHGLNLFRGICPALGLSGSRAERPYADREAL
jgi:hypothetical protein